MEKKKTFTAPIVIYECRQPKEEDEGEQVVYIHA